VRENIFVWGYLAAMLGFLMTPLVSVAAASFEDGLGHYAALFVNARGSITFVPPIEAVRNSLFFAGVTIFLAVGLGLIAAYAIADENLAKVATPQTARGLRPSQGSRMFSRILDPLFMLPLGTSAVTLGFGFILALGNLRTSIWLVPIVHTLVAFPFVVRSLLPMLRSIQPRLREAAQMLGASPWRVWREIDLPMVARAVVIGAVFAFTVSIGEFGATALVARPELPTIPIAIYRFLGQPGIANFGQALALSTILMVVSALAIVTMERVRVGAVGEF